jgi:hypothetical protein
MARAKGFGARRERKNRAAGDSTREYGGARYPNQISQTDKTTPTANPSRLGLFGPDQMMTATASTTIPRSIKNARGYVRVKLSAPTMSTPIEANIATDGTVTSWSHQRGD